MKLTRLLSTKFGRIMISILMGLGLATLFRKACKDKTCLSFNGPIISEVDGKTYQFGEYCYKYDLMPSKCDSIKRTVEIDDSVARTVKEEQQKEEESKNSVFSFLK
jgi:hypothetical protein